MYSLSRRQYTEARAVIEGHYWLSQLAGKERPLKEFSLETLGVAVFAIFVEDAAALLSESEVAAIWGILSAGDSLGAGEDYDPQVKALLEGRVPTSAADVIRNLRNKPTHLRRGLVRLGQLTLIAALDALVSPDEIQQFQDYRRNRA